MKFFLREEDGSESGPHSASRLRGMLGSWERPVRAEHSDQWVPARNFASEISGTAARKEINQRTRAWWTAAVVLLIIGQVCAVFFAIIGCAATVPFSLTCAIVLLCKKAWRRGLLALLFTGLNATGAAFYLTLAFM